MSRSFLMNNSAVMRCLMSPADLAVKGVSGPLGYLSQPIGENTAPVLPLRHVQVTLSERVVPKDALT